MHSHYRFAASPLDVFVKVLSMLRLEGRIIVIINEPVGFFKLIVRSIMFGPTYCTQIASFFPLKVQKPKIFISVT